ncbi:MAG: SEC-C metal-binding domain-containing protein, partial [Anaerolineae bacterium]
MVGRNDPCPCGSGKKYKKCCLKKDEEAWRAQEEAERAVR